MTGVKSGNDVLKIMYDANSRPAMVEYNGVWYGYVKNLQGDIVTEINFEKAHEGSYSDQANNQT